LISKLIVAVHECSEHSGRKQCLLSMEQLLLVNSSSALDRVWKFSQYSDFLQQRQPGSGLLDWWTKCADVRCVKQT